MYLLGFCEETSNIWQLVGVLINIFKIVTPIIIVMFAMVDLGKAVIAGEEKEIKTAQKMLIKRLIYGVVIFFVITIVKTVFGLIGSYTTEGICWDCVTQPESKNCKNAVALCVEKPESKKCKDFIATLKK